MIEQRTTLGKVPSTTTSRCRVQFSTTPIQFNTSTNTQLPLHQTRQVFGTMIPEHFSVQSFISNLFILAGLWPWQLAHWLQALQTNISLADLWLRGMAVGAESNGLTVQCSD